MRISPSPLMILEAMRDGGREPRFHGNGFTQLYLDSTTRLHIWSPNLPAIPGNNATIHDHTFDMESTILYGYLDHVTRDVQILSDSDETLSIGNDYSLYRINKTLEPHVREQVGRARLYPRHRYRLTRGSRYTFRHGLFHSSDSADHSATMMRKTTEYGGEPTIAAPIGLIPTDAFAPEFQPEPGLMWRAIGNGLQQMEPWALKEVALAVESGYDEQQRPERPTPKDATDRAYLLGSGRYNHRSS